MNDIDIDIYVYVIIGLLPLAALILVLQVNPYNGLIIRAILGEIAALVYALLGAADVALTEALVATMLAVSLYVITVRSSLVMRLGILKEVEAETESYMKEVVDNMRKIIDKYHLRLELVEYPTQQALEGGLRSKEVHTIFGKPDELKLEGKQTYQTTTRVYRLFEIMEKELTLSETTVRYINVSNLEEKD
ncbi:MAG: DUF4040 domain-containing protein [Trichodesmium sp. St16_bin4-tuft]|uniref:Putative multicomponent Na+:H+ antiporter subunit B n=1 Tax=Trichodesmium erythraeum (strain IMS101) TaxID=203124 RepID=Q115C6_TRIEI|nr:DUF4040 domain-containing protein [Trichodesmium erythraeum GBRTRLIN201]MCH2047685.1 DUF4040 domain-containing protein [Trichodesmium sp. ALOHA_ZT_67]MCL2929740.1 DUF4040 domain-containing protein [Trichodesmium sp. MAG_R01]MDE5069472.1 DUF4040 domain-containing protein [Trichodesmium sp. St4_bin8_1]MDE5072245.1 DUF4040 domain-containing protein [Trichodesmium sp. St5_bin8]MDE5078617.1 DUF4040 domain-containing protein [Trichodesmium sp. St2_bin6]MDE5095663.1 DUF4040 domain-containing prot